MLQGVQEDHFLIFDVASAIVSVEKVSAYMLQSAKKINWVLFCRMIQRWMMVSLRAYNGCRFGDSLN